MEKCYCLRGGHICEQKATKLYKLRDIHKLKGTLIILESLSRTKIDIYQGVIYEIRNSNDKRTDFCRFSSKRFC